VKASDPNSGPSRSDGGAAENGVGVVEDGGLAGGYAAGGLAEGDLEGVPVETGLAGVDLAVSAELDLAVAGLGERGAAGPDRALGGDVADVELLGRANGYRAETGSMPRT
jgi:hypothetical protein